MEIDSYYILCPYCQSKCGDVDDFENCGWDNATEGFECEECGKKFEGRKVVIVDYRTEKDCELNGEEHKEGKYHCENCDVYNSSIGEKDGK